MSPVSPLSDTQLCHLCDPDQFAFETTAELEPREDAIGQTRATRAVRFGIGIRREGYNLFATGPAGAGKHTLVRTFLERQAADEPVPPDICYINNFERSHEPRALLLPAGKGRALRSDVSHLIEDLRTVLPTAFDSDDFRKGKEAIETDLKTRHQKKLSELEEKAMKSSIAIVRAPGGLALAPMDLGEIISPDEFEKLPEEKRKKFLESMEQLQSELREALELIPRFEKEARERIRKLIREIAGTVTASLIGDIKRKYDDLPDVMSFLAALENDVLNNVDDFLKPDEQKESSGLGLSDFGTTRGGTRFRRYQVNLLIDHSESKGAPVIYENHPAYQKLVGRIEHLSQLGTLVTDFNLIKAGALHKANGGYLILDARNLLVQPYAWEGLKRALLAHEIRIESLGQMLSLITTVSLEPEPIPLKIKVVLLGERGLLSLLSKLDPDFYGLFKVAVDFEDEIDRSPENALAYAQMIASVAQREGLRPFTKSGVAAVLNQVARASGDSEKLSAHMGELLDVLREADYWAGTRNAVHVQADDVERAIAGQYERVGRLRERVLEEIERGVFLIDTAGSKVGQINGLSVYLDGRRAAFGRPSRITAKVRLGKGQLIDIEREVELSGPIHSKGVFILSGFLGGRYAPNHPLSLDASIVFEQSYGIVEGDSASCAELCALLSALAEVPLKQSLAMTGSVNQHGQVQAIGGVNEKIEGFFDVCKARGITGNEGVVIPKSNVRHLMLRSDVVEAVRKGIFSIYPIETVDEALELLTDVPAGERDASGEFPKGTVNQLVEARLIALAERRLALGNLPASKAEKGNNNSAV